MRCTSHTALSFVPRGVAKTQKTHMENSSINKGTFQKAKQAWLITWEWAGGHAEVKNRVAAIVSGRVSQSYIEKLVEQIWAARELAWFEQLSYAKTRSRIAYRAESRQLFEGQVTCGHNPWLEANRVYNLQAYLDESGREHLIWKYWKPSLKNDKVESTYLSYHLVKEIDGTEHNIDWL